MPDRSKLGDLIVEHGPYSQDLLFGAGLSSDLRWVRAVELNALRDELTRLRRVEVAVEHYVEGWTAEPGDPVDVIRALQVAIGDRT